MAKPAGYAMLIGGDPTDADAAAAVTVRPTIELSKFYLMPGHHGTGVAGILMAAALGVARESGAAAVWLGVNEENERANRFYAKHGFAEVGRKHFTVGDRVENDFVRLRAPLGHGTASTSLPRVWPSSRMRCASAASARSKTWST